MAITRCPRCDVPMTEQEASLRRCPACGQRLGRRMSAGASPSARDRSMSKLLLGGAAAMALILAAMFLRSGFGRGQEGAERRDFLSFRVSPAPDVQPVPTTQPAMEPAPREPAPTTEPALPPEVAPQASVAPATQPARPAAIVQSPSAPVERPAEPTAPEPEAVVAGGTLMLDKPDGEHIVEALDAEDEVRLSGRVGTLRIAGMNGRAVLDASKLQAKHIVCSGSIDGSAMLRLRAPGGTIEFRSPINGDTRLELTAPDGAVRFKAPEGVDRPTVINGSPQFVIVAREVSIGGTVNGGGQIHITFTKGGTLRFDELTGGTRLIYSAEDSPQVAIDSGRITGGAKITRGD